MRKAVIPILTGAAFAALGSVNPAMAEIINYRADLAGVAELPPVTTNGGATARVALDTGTMILSWTITYSGLSGPATAVHFHGPAKQGQNAPIQVSVTLASPITGSTRITASQEADLDGGRWYANIHTAAHPGGEIRGQLARVP